MRVSASHAFSGMPYLSDRNRKGTVLALCCRVRSLASYAVTAPVPFLPLVIDTAVSAQAGSGLLGLWAIYSMLAGWAPGHPCTTSQTALWMTWIRDSSSDPVLLFSALIGLFCLVCLVSSRTASSLPVEMSHILLLIGMDVN